MKEKKIFVLFTYSPFPFGEAVSNRIYALAKSLILLDYEIIILSNGGKRNEDYNIKKNKYVYKNIEYRDFSNKKNNKFQRLIKRNNIYKLINDYFNHEEINRIDFIYFTYRNFGIIPYFKMKLLKIPCVVDVTEWHSCEQFPLSFLNPKYILHNIKIRFIVEKASNIICISHFLENYFKTKKCNTILIPPQIDILDFERNKMETFPPIKLVYGGTWAKKDYIDIALEGLCLLSRKELELVKFTLVGFDCNSFFLQFPNANKYIEILKNSLEIISRMPKRDFDKVLNESHFLVLLRPNSRYSKAGFPSKVPEALAAGLPIITNSTGDLSCYIKENINGFIVKEFTANEFYNTMQEVLIIKQSDFLRMSLAAYNTAEECFNYDIIVDSLREFLDKATLLSRG